MGTHGSHECKWVKMGRVQSAILTHKTGWVPMGMGFLWVG